MEQTMEQIDDRVSLWDEEKYNAEQESLRVEQELLREVNIHKIMIIKKSKFVPNDYNEAIIKIKKIFENLENLEIDKNCYSISRLHDTSITIGLCGYYLSSVSLKYKCPFDSRNRDHHFFSDIEYEMNPDKKYNVLFSKYDRTNPRCVNYCRILKYENSFNKEPHETIEYLSKDCYDNVIAPIMKDFLLKI